MRSDASRCSRRCPLAPPGRRPRAPASPTSRRRQASPTSPRSTTVSTAPDSRPPKASPPPNVSASAPSSTSARRIATAPFSPGRASGTWSSPCLQWSMDDDDVAAFLAVATDPAMRPGPRPLRGGPRPHGPRRRRLPRGRRPLVARRRRARACASFGPNPLWVNLGRAASAASSRRPPPRADAASHRGPRARPQRGRDARRASSFAAISARCFACASPSGRLVDERQGLAQRVLGLAGRVGAARRRRPGPRRRSALSRPGIATRSRARASASVRSSAAQPLERRARRTPRPRARARGR